MRRLSRVEKVKIVKMAKIGSTLTEISKVTGIKRTTVYYWVRKALGKRIQNIIVNENDMEAVGEIIGAFAGDGAAGVEKNYQYVVRFFLSKDEEEYSQRLAKLLRSIYGVEPWVYKNGCITLKTKRKKIFQHMKKYLQWDEDIRRTYTVRLRKNINELNKEFLVGFLRGIFDTEGFVYIAKCYIGVCVTSRGLADDISNSLTALDILHRRYEFTPKPPRKTLYGIRITEMAFLRKFQEIIEFNNQLKRNKLSVVLRSGFEPEAQAFPKGFERPACLTGLHYRSTV